MILVLFFGLPLTSSCQARHKSLESTWLILTTVPRKASSTNCRDIPQPGVGVKRLHLSKFWHKVLVIFGTAGLLILVCVATYTIFPRFENLSTRAGRELGHCGTNVEEARAQGCVFDYLSYVWVQPPCFYPDLLEGYQKRNGVQWYREPSLDERYRIPDSEIQRGDHPVAFAPRKFHSMHCAFTVSKTHYALANHKSIDNMANSFEHTEHCEMVLLDEMPECADESCRISRVNAKFSTCGWV